MALLDSTKTIDGSFGRIYEGANWLSNFNSATLTIEVNYEEIRRSGTRTVGNKPTTVKISGSISGYKITSELAQRIAQVTDDRKGPLITELIFRLDDPSAYGYESVRVKGVQFTTIDAIKFEHGTIVEQEFPFVAEGIEWLSAIKQD